MFSISRSKLSFPTQLVFLLLNGLGVASGTIYNVRTPDLYENNAHHKIGWIATWVMIVQVGMSLIFTYSGGRRKATPVSRGEQAAFLPISAEAMAQHYMRPYSDYRWSGDSGHGTERSSMHNSRDVSPIDPNGRDNLAPYKPEPELDGTDDELETRSDRSGFLCCNFIDQHLSRYAPSTFPGRLLKTFEILNNAIDRTILILGFVAFTTGGVTYAGIFVISPGVVMAQFRSWLTLVIAI
jgi:hypothetical protein